MGFRDALASVGYSINPARIKNLPGKMRRLIQKGECASCGKPINKNKRGDVSCGRSACIKDVKDALKDWETAEEAKKKRKAHHGWGQNKNGIAHLPSCGCNMNNLLHGKNCAAAGKRMPR